MSTHADDEMCRHVVARFSYQTPQPPPYPGTMASQPLTTKNELRGLTLRIARVVAMMNRYGYRVTPQSGAMLQDVAAATTDFGYFRVLVRSGILSSTLPVESPNPSTPIHPSDQIFPKSCVGCLSRRSIFSFPTPNAPQPTGGQAARPGAGWPGRGARLRPLMSQLKPIEAGPPWLN